MGIDQNRFAEITSLTEQELADLLSGQAPLTEETATRLAQATTIPARTWNNLEANYREQLARLESREQSTSPRE